MNLPAAASNAAHGAGPPRVRGAITASFAAHGVVLITNLAAVPLFLSAFGAEAYGFWSALLGLTSYLSLLNLGIAQAVSSRVATLDPVRDVDLIRATIRHGFVRFALSVVLAMPVVIAAAWLIPWGQLFSIRAYTELELKVTAAVVAATFLVRLPFNVVRAALTGLGGVATDRFINMLAGVLRLAAAWFIAHVGVSLTSAVLWLFVLELFAAGLAAAALNARVPRLLGGKSAPLQGQDQTALRSSSGHYLLLQIAGALVWSTDVFLAGVLLDATSAAKVSVAWRVASSVLAFGSLLGPAIAPAAVRLWASGAMEEARRLTGGAAQIAFGLTALAACGLATLGNDLFAVWVGTAVYAGDAMWLGYIAVVVLQGLVHVPDSFVVQTGRHYSYARWTLFEAAIKLVLTLSFVPWLGLIGLPLATLIGRLPTSWVLLQETAGALERRTLAWIWQAIRPALAPATIYAVLALAMRVAFPQQSPYFHLVLATAIGVLALAAFWSLGLPRVLRSQIVAAVTPRRQKPT